MAGVPKLRNASTARCYDGTVNSAGQPHGRGVAEFDDGTRYEGDFWDGEVAGLAIGSAPHGGTFEGRFARGQLPRLGQLPRPRAGGGHGEALQEASRQRRRTRTTTSRTCPT